MRSFLTGAPPLKEQFVKYSLPDDFIEGLQADINDFEQFMTEKSSASGEKVQPPLQSEAQLNLNSNPYAAADNRPEQIPQ